MKFSLILATKGRSTELLDLLNSLKRQTYPHFELIVVDQNEDDRVKKVLSAFAADLEIVHLRSAPGLSRARNRGLAFAHGHVVCFPDDDCWFADTTLEQVYELLSEHPDWDGVSGRCFDTNMCPSVTDFDKKEGFIDKFNVWRRTNSISYFIKTAVVRAAGGFDEQLGIGAGTLWGSGEDTDLPLKIVERGGKIYYSFAFHLYHPQVREGEVDSRLIERHISYARGMGRVLRLHDYPVWFVVYVVSRKLGGAAKNILYLRPDRALLDLKSAYARLYGWASFG